MYDVLAIFCVAVLAFLLGVCVASESLNAEWQRELIKRGLAQRNPKTGVWKWKPSSTQGADPMSDRTGFTELADSQSRLRQPTLADLSAALRDPSTWPKGFVWGYWHCATCAMGLAFELGMTKDSDLDEIVRVFGVPDREARYIFTQGGARHVFFRQITPEMVADDIDEYLVAQRAPRPKELK